MRVVGLLAISAAALCLFAGATPKRTAHAVTLRVTSFTGDSVVVRFAASPPGIRLAGDTTLQAVDSLTVRTPADVRVSAAVQRLRLWTERNLAVRIQFIEGASEKERTLAPWGRRLLFVRSDGDLQPEAEVMNACTTHTHGLHGQPAARRPLCTIAPR